MVVVCPKCKTKLRVGDEKISSSGSRFKCPKCSAVLLVKKPPAASPGTVNKGRILVAHSNDGVSNEILQLLQKRGYETVAASDGIETMVKAVRERPFLAILEVALPKIYGFDVCRRLKQRPETAGMKFILVSSVYDKDKYRRGPESLYGADDYVEEHAISELLIERVNALKAGAAASEKAVETAAPPPPAQPESFSAEAAHRSASAGAAAATAAGHADETVAKAKRLARTVVSDIYLYNVSKADEAIRNGSFHKVFESEIREGLKLYESRIPQLVRAKGDFFQEAIRDFIDNKRESF
jgi:predicted Zn finger-like uncharacterized protein